MQRRINCQKRTLLSCEICAKLKVKDKFAVRSPKLEIRSMNESRFEFNSNSNLNSSERRKEKMCLTCKKRAFGKKSFALLCFCSVLLCLFVDLWRFVLVRSLQARSCESQLEEARQEATNSQQCKKAANNEMQIRVCLPIENCLFAQISNKFSNFRTRNFFESSAQLQHFSRLEMRAEFAQIWRQFDCQTQLQFKLLLCADLFVLIPTQV